MEDLPFGAVLRDLNTTEIPVEYDSRYFTEEAMTVLSNYFYAIQTEDTALYQEVTLDFYDDYVMQQMFQGLVGLDGLLTQLKSSYTPQQSATGTSTENADADVTFTQINVVECEQSTDSVHSNLDNLYPMLNELSGEEDYCTQHVSDAKFFKPQPVPQERRSYYDTFGSVCVSSVRGRQVCNLLVSGSSCAAVSASLAACSACFCLLSSFIRSAIFLIGMP